MSDPDNNPTGGKQDWEGLREVDRAIAELDDDDRKGQAVWQRVLESAKESQHREGSGNGPAE